MHFSSFSNKISITTNSAVIFLGTCHNQTSVLQTKEGIKQRINQQGRLIDDLFWNYNLLIKFVQFLRFFILSYFYLKISQL